MKNSMEQNAPSTAQANVELKTSESKVKHRPINVQLVTSRIRYYDGRLFWMKREVLNGFHKTWNKKYEGKAADNKKDTPGYRLIMIDGVYYKAHRIIWAIMHQQDPSSFDIDHINCIRDDNRIENLRLATCSQNKMNIKTRKDNSSGVKGVSWFSRDKRWVAQIWIDGKKNVLGHFKEKDDAAKAYAEASKRIHKEFGRLE